MLTLACTQCLKGRVTWRSAIVPQPVTSYIIFMETFNQSWPTTIGACSQFPGFIA